MSSLFVGYHLSQINRTTRKKDSERGRERRERKGERERARERRERKTAREGERDERERAREKGRERGERERQRERERETKEKGRERDERERARETRDERRDERDVGCLSPACMSRSLSLVSLSLSFLSRGPVYLTSMVSNERRRHLGESFSTGIVSRYTSVLFIYVFIISADFKEVIYFEIFGQIWIEERERSHCTCYLLSRATRQKERGRESVLIGRAIFSPGDQTERERESHRKGCLSPSRSLSFFLSFFIFLYLYLSLPPSLSLSLSLSLSHNGHTQIYKWPPSMKRQGSQDISQ